MCGIAGVWAEQDETHLDEMLDLLRHRGPDDSGQLLSQHGQLGHQRLSIVDPTGGRQPIYGKDPLTAVVVNGEIYNHLSLRRNLPSRHQFRSSSDSEVVVHLYEEHGPEAVRRLDGMYAIALADGPVVFVARDPVGIKPLYYVKKDGTFRFASEIKALRRWAPDVQEFPPGMWFRTDSGFHPFHRLEPPAPERESAETWQGSLRHRLEEAVEKRMMSDVPVGTFLSGGLDSSIITALARQHVDELHTVSVGTEGSPDLQAARQVSRSLGTIHHEYVFGPQDVIDSLPEIVYHLESFDVDLVRSAIPCYFASRIASEHVKVILTGEGADELFAGYEYHRSFDRPEELQAELLQSVSALHSMNLQRVDRMTMAHSIEGRVPFLDLQVIDVAQRIPPGLKLCGSPPVEKWILRAACEDLLPHDILWRTKAQFDVGSGTVALLDRVLPDLVNRFGLCAACAQHGRRLESMLYRLLYRQRLPEATERLVARWRGGAV